MSSRSMSHWVLWAVGIFGLLLIFMELFENQWRLMSWFELSPFILLVPLVMFVWTRRPLWGWVLLLSFVIQQVYRWMYFPMTGLFFVVFFGWVFYQGIKASRKLTPRSLKSTGSSKEAAEK